jgi:transcriptional regulator with XRE-family HTH domain
MANMIGERLRGVRQSQGRSLADVAGVVDISVATLSRIENDKQSVDMGMFLLLAGALHTPAHELIDDGSEREDGNVVDPLARRISALGSTERTELWRGLAAERRSQRSKVRGAELRNASQQVDELLAQVEFLREELEGVRKRIRRRG